ncbi:unnamed protein product [Didymodactylos carnosus]|uniref:Nuclear receptor domain-containing protein n=1 Tax=Didymodactylos carnosus TaxID=1234261 RepID=A0A814WK51_9BILA|nr:unnamed protein product [Didymodactylos carnosus]CAF1202299.1 unnamed protein product [Didymodactylos carnosus]CAF3574902.1 unnamed protein product [Didymodactylos carnosus]CAF3966698.1 unnamed protein product [Didymodactylos carnosus]
MNRTNLLPFNEFMIDNYDSKQQKQLVHSQSYPPYYSTSSTDLSAYDEISKFIDEIEELDPQLNKKMEKEDGIRVEQHKKHWKCMVCRADAFGFNFGQITCESCKAFFRRNALLNKPDLKCHLSGYCEMNVNTRRQCTYCRLQKCFDVGMRKEWIRTDKEKHIKKCLMSNNRLLKETVIHKQTVSIFYFY